MPADSVSNQPLAPAVLQILLALSGEDLHGYGIMNAALLLSRCGADESLESILTAHLDNLQPGRYFGLLAYVEMSAEHG